MEGIIKLFHAELQQENANVKVIDVMPYLIKKFNAPEGYERYGGVCHMLRNKYAHSYQSGWNSDFEADQMLETFNVLKDLIYIYLTRNMSLESSNCFD